MGDFRALYGALSGKEEEAEETEPVEMTFTKSSEGPPRLPEIPTRQHYVLDRPGRSGTDIGTRSLSHEDSRLPSSSKHIPSPQILSPPSLQRLRVVSVIEGKDDWRVRTAPEDDAEPDNKKKDRWSQMLLDVTGLVHIASAASAALEAEPELEKEAAAAAEGVLTPPESVKGDETKKDGVEDEDEIPLSELRTILRSSPPPPATTVTPQTQVAPPTSPIRRHPSNPHSLLSRSGSGRAAAPTQAFSDTESGTSEDGQARRATFDSLQVVGRKGSQRIPTFDSQGRRIGVLDHGKFSTETTEGGAAGEGDKTPASPVSSPVLRNGSVRQSGATGATATGSISVRGNLLHLTEEGVDVLVMEMVSGRLHIVAGTLEKLLFRLADENIQDLDFVDTLIQCHSFFISSLDLMDNLIMRYNVRPPEEATGEEMEYYHKWRKPIQLKVLTVLTRWLQLHYESFETNPMLHERLEIFLSDVWMDGFRSESDRVRRVAAVQASKIHMKARSGPVLEAMVYRDEEEEGETDGGESTVAGSDGNALERLLTGRERSVSPAASSSSKKSKKARLERHSPRVSLLSLSLAFPSLSTSKSPSSSSSTRKLILPTSSAPPTTSTSLHYLKNISPSMVPDPASMTQIFLSCDAGVMARYMTVADQNAFAAIPMLDYLAKLAGSNVGGANGTGGGNGIERRLGARVDLFAERANAIRNWTSLEILSTRLPKPRRRVIEKFIHIARRCIDLHNFHTSLFIVSGLLSPPVQRLKKTWENIQPKDLAMLKEMETLLDPSGNMRNLRNAMSKAGVPSLPFFPIVMKDLTFLNDGNPGIRPPTLARTSSASSNSSGSLSPPLINFDKYRNLCGVIAKYTGPALESYEFSMVMQSALRGLPGGGEVGLWVAVVARLVEGRLKSSGEEGIMEKVKWEVEGEDL
ncbi:hypothetical protein HDU97_001462 [Phlyctochytrium planicorne]|nr:hypothetical protein HDU97_001462 [Phlyctochytrium planicorne]